jgi:hypothetical protein
MAARPSRFLRGRSTAPLRVDYDTSDPERPRRVEDDHETHNQTERAPLRISIDTGLSSSGVAGHTKLGDCYSVRSAVTGLMRVERRAGR